MASTFGCTACGGPAEAGILWPDGSRDGARLPTAGLRRGFLSRSSRSRSRDAKRRSPRLARTPRLGVQTHGMVMPDHCPIAKVMDAVPTRRILARADAVAVLTDTEDSGVRAVAHGLITAETLPDGMALGAAS